MARPSKMAWAEKNTKMGNLVFSPRTSCFGMNPTFLSCLEAQGMICSIHAARITEPKHKRKVCETTQERSIYPKATPLPCPVSWEVSISSKPGHSVSALVLISQGSCNEPAAAARKGKCGQVVSYCQRILLGSPF